MEGLRSQFFLYLVFICGSTNQFQVQLKRFHGTVSGAGVTVKWPPGIM